MFLFHDFMFLSVAARLLNTQSFTLPVDRNKTRKSLDSVLKTVLSEWCLPTGRSTRHAASSATVYKPVAGIDTCSR